MTTGTNYAADRSRFVRKMAELSGYELGQTADGWFLIARATGEPSVLGTGRSLDDIAAFLLTDEVP